MLKKIESIYKFLIPISFAFLLFKENILSLLVILITLNTLFYYLFNKKKVVVNKKILFLAIPFLIVSFKSLVSMNFIESLNHIKHSLLFLIIPVVFSIIPNYYFKSFNTQLMLIFKTSCLVVLLTYIVCFIIDTDWNYLLFVSHNDSEFRRYVYFETPIFKIHPAYFTSCLIIGTSHSLLNLVKNKKKIELVFIIPFVFTTIILLTKLNIVLLLLIILYFLFFVFEIEKKQKTILISCFVFFGCLTFLYVPGLKDRFFELLNSYDKEPVSLNYDSTTIRKSIYNCSINLAKENYIFGTGFSEIQNKLNNCYKENYDSNFYVNHNYLTHNYFLYILISSGIFGLISLLYFWCRLLKRAIEIKNLLLNILLINTFLMCLIEDYFYRQYGVFFFLFFYISITNYLDLKTVSNEP